MRTDRNQQVIEQLKAAISILEAAPREPKNDWGEPWVREVWATKDRSGTNLNQRKDADECWHRTIACVNALAGIADPASFVAKAQGAAAVVTSEEAV